MRVIVVVSDVVYGTDSIRYVTRGRFSWKWSEWRLKYKVESPRPKDNWERSCLVVVREWKHSRKGAGGLKLAAG